MSGSPTFLLAPSKKQGSVSRSGHARGGTGGAAVGPADESNGDAGVAFVSPAGFGRIVLLLGPRACDLVCGPRCDCCPPIERE